MRLLSLALLVAPLACATNKPEPKAQSLQPTPAASAEQKARVASLLNAYEGPPSPEQWKALGPEGLTTLRQIAADPAELPTRRARAVAGIAYLEDPTAADVLQSFAADGNQLALVRKSAALALAAREGPKSVPALSPLLTDGNVEVRQAAARALGSAGGPDARTALQGRLDAETDPKVRDEIQKSLAKVTN